jgi:hypothetical protein
VRRVLVLVSLIAGCGRFGFGPNVERTDASTGDSSVVDGATADGAPGDGAGDDAIVGSSSHVQASPAVGVVGPFTMTLPAPSTAGSLLVVALGTSSTSSMIMPTGWVIAEQASISGGCIAAIAYYPNNPGGIQAVTFDQPTLIPTVAQLTEWIGARAVDALGTATSSAPVATLTVQTATTTTAGSGVAINVFCEAVNMPQYTTGAGWTNLATASKGPSEASFSTNYQLGYAAGTTVAGIVTTTVAGKYAAVIATFSP